LDAYAIPALLKQEQLRGFVQWQVHGCVTGLVDYILRKGDEDVDVPFVWDDVANLYMDHRIEIEELKDQLMEVEDRIDALVGVRIHMKQDKEVLASLEKLRDELEDRILDLEDEQDRPQDVFEWWHVSGQLIYWLEQKGEPVLADHHLWGRTCTGQAIYMDSVIEEIYDELMEKRRAE
jgi:hypothetical protein